MSGPMGGQPGWTRPIGGKGGRRMMTKGIKVGSYVLVKYFKPWRSGGQEEDIADYEGTITEKRMSSQDRESHVVLNDVLKLLEGKIVGYEKTKRVYDVFIEDCREVNKREQPSEALAAAVAKADEDAKKPAIRDVRMRDMPGMAPMGMSLPMMAMNPMNIMGMNPMGMMSMASGMGGIAGGNICGNMTLGMNGMVGGMNCMPNSVVGNSMGCTGMAMGMATGMPGCTGNMAGNMGGMGGDMLGMTNRMRCMDRAASGMTGDMFGSKFSGMQGMNGSMSGSKNVAPKPARVYGNTSRNSSNSSFQHCRPIGDTKSRSRSRPKKS